MSGFFGGAIFPRLLVADQNPTQIVNTVARTLLSTVTIPPGLLAVGYFLPIFQSLELSNQTGAPVDFLMEIETNTNLVLITSFTAIANDDYLFISTGGAQVELQGPLQTDLGINGRLISSMAVNSNPSSTTFGTSIVTDILNTLNDSVDSTLPLTIDVYGTLSVADPAYSVTNNFFNVGLST